MAVTLTRFMPDIPLWRPCDNRISLLCLPRAALIPGDFSDRSFSLFKPCKAYNKLQHVIMLGILGRALLCGLLGTPHSSCVSHQCPLQHTRVMVSLENTPFHHCCIPRVACYWLSRTRCGEYREKDFSLCVSALVCISVFMFIFLLVMVTNEPTIPFQN